MAERLPPKPTILFGWITILFWLAFMLSFLPLRSAETAKSLASGVSAAESKQTDPAYDLSQTDLQDAITRVFQNEFMRALILSLAGVLSGVLLVFRRRAGRFLAVSLCFLGLLGWLISMVKLAMNTEFLPAFFDALKQGGMQVNLINPLFFALSIFLLTTYRVDPRF